MGLTISWNLELNSASIDEVRAKIAHLRKLALKLPFQQVEELVEIEGEACIFDKYDLQDPHIFLKLRGLKATDIALNGCSAVDSTYLIAFDSLPGEGCETAAFGLAAHSDPLESVNDWYWTGFCKTQYASNPQYGGMQNFVNCHLAIVTMLDEAQKLGITCDVTDGSDYWENRDINGLVDSVRESNLLIAALTGSISNQFKTTDTKIYAPILEYPNFEYLEAEGAREQGGLGDKGTRGRRAGEQGAGEQGDRS